MVSELSEKLVTTLAAAEAPVPYTRLRKKLIGAKTGKAEEALQTALRETRDAGKIHSCGDIGRGKQCYWHRGRADYLSDALAASCAARAATRAELKAPGFSAPEVRAATNELLSLGRLRKFPAIGRERERIGTTPESYYAALREFVAAKCKKAGLASFELAAQPVAVPAPALAEPDAALEQRILDALHQLEAGPGVSVATVVLRRHLQIDSSAKAAFDRAVLALRDRRLVYLARHHNPYLLSAEDRGVLIEDADGSQYVAVALRRDS